MISQIAKILNLPLKRILLFPAVVAAGATYYWELGWIWSLIFGLGMIFIPPIILELYLNALLVKRSRISKPYMERAKAHEENAEYGLAISEYSRAIEMHKPDKWLFRELLTFPRLFERVTEVTNLEPWLLRNRAWCYERKGFLNKAIADLTTIIDMDHRVRGHAYLNEITTDSELLRITNRRANIYFEIGEFEPALTDYMACLKLDPGLRGVPLFTSDFRFLQFGSHDSFLNLSEVFCHMGHAYYAIENYDNAISIFSWAIHFGKRSMDLQDCHEGRAKAYEAKGEYELAAADFEAACQIFLGHANDGNEDRGRADELIEEGNRYYFGAGFSLAHEEDSNLADEDRSDDDYLLEEEVDLRKACELAIAKYSEAIEVAPNYPEAYHSRAEVYILLEEYELAISDLDKAITLDPSDCEFYAFRGDAYLGLTQYQSAIDDFTKVIELAPRLSSGYEQRARAYEALGNTELAAEDRATSTLL